MISLKFFLFLIPIASGLVIDCELKEETWGVILNVSVCDATKNLSITLYDTLITGVFVHNWPPKNLKSVTAFRSDSSSQTIHCIPSGLTKFFQNLTAIHINNGRIKDVYQGDLKEYTNLTFLNLDDNDITSLGADLFKFNPNLTVVSIADNKIAEVHPSVFNNLKQLKFFSISNNVCINGREYAKNNTEISKLIKRVQQQCQPIYLILDLFDQIDLHQQQISILRKITGAIFDEIEEIQGIRTNNTNDKLN